MKSVTKRLRYRSGRTDYRHRAKMLKNYDHILRIHLNKKVNYYLCGFYHTHDPTQSDHCYGYYQSRWLKSGIRILRTNQRDLKLFGSAVGVQLNNAHTMYDFKDKTLILDVARRKNLRFKSFLEGLFSTLSPLLQDNFRISKELRDTLELSTEQVPLFSSKL